MTSFRALCALMLIAFAPPAMAFDLEKAIERFDNLSLACQGESDHDGEKISTQQALDACRDLLLVLYDLGDSGYCWSEDRSKFVQCTFAD